MPPARAPQIPSWLPVAGLSALAFAVYANSLGNGFIGDDQFQLLRNPLIKDLSNIPKFFTGGVWSFLGVTSNYYRPLQFLLYALIAQVAGLQPWAFHLFMVLLHVANTVLLYRFVQHLARGPIAIASAALFAVHPIHTEAVDWAASLPDLTVTALVLTGLLLFARQSGEPRGPQVLVHCLLYLMALWTKETGVMMAALYAGFGFWSLGRHWSELRRNALLYAGMAATFGVYLAMRLAALGSFAPRRVAFFHLSPTEFAMSVVVTAAQYLKMLVAPHGLNYFHVFHPATTISLGFLISLAALALVAWLFWGSREALPAYGIFWIAVSLAPALNLTALGQNVFTERYLYLPSVGFCWIAGWAWAHYAERGDGWAKPAGIALLVIFAIAAVARNRDWHDNFGLLQVTEKESPDSGWVHDALAGEYIQRDAFDRGLEEERLAVRYDPQMALYHKKLGYILLGKDNRGAAAEFEQVNRLEPGVAANLVDLAAALEASGDAAGALREYQSALNLAPNNVDAKRGYEREKRVVSNQ